MRSLVAWGMLLVAATTQAIDARDVQGLEVAVQQIEEPVRVDGIALRIARATGPGVIALAQRVQSRWREEGAEVRTLQQPGWQLRARWFSGESELIQWRARGDDAELLHSRLVVTQRPARVASAPFRLPPGCAWGRAIEGDAQSSRFLQRTAFCRATARSVLTGLRAHLRAQQWTVSEPAAGALQVRKGALRGMLLVATQPRSAGSALVWIGAGEEP